MQQKSATGSVSRAELKPNQAFFEGYFIEIISLLEKLSLQHVIVQTNEIALQLGIKKRDILLKTATVHRENGSLGLARDLFCEAAALDASDPQPFMQAAEIMLDAALWHKQEFYLKMAQEVRAYDQVWFKLCRCYTGMGKLDLAKAAADHLPSRMSGVWQAGIELLRRAVAGAKDDISEYFRNRTKVNFQKASRAARGAVKLGRLSLATILIRKIPETNREYFLAKTALLTRESGIVFAYEWLKNCPYLAEDRDLTLVLIDLAYQNDDVEFIAKALDGKHLLGPVSEVQLRCRLNAIHGLSLGVDRIKTLMPPNLLDSQNSKYLLQAYRQKGVLKSAAPVLVSELKPPSEEDIPFSLVQFWNEPEPPEEVLQLSSLWTKFNPGLQYKLFDEIEARQFMVQHFSADYVRAYDLASHPAMKSDIFRLAFIHIEGGFYADSDEQCMGQLWGMYQACKSFCGVFGLMGSYPTYVNNNFFAARKRAPLVKAFLDEAVKGTLAHAPEGHFDIGKLTGPGLFTRVIVKFLLADENALNDHVLCPKARDA